MINYPKIKINKYLICILFLILYTSCNQEEAKVNVLKSYFPKDKQIVYSEYIVKNGDTILDGNYKVYTHEGKKVKSGKYKNGKSIGAVIFYYDNGIIETIENNYNNKFRDVVFNHTNGKTERYELYDNYGNLNFIINFDSLGNIINYKGFSIMEIYQYKYANKKQFDIKEDQHLKVGDDLKYRYILANIPNVKRSLKIENLSIGNSNVKRTIKETEPCQIDVEEVLIKKGKNTIRSIVRYEFNDKITPVFTDTLSFDVDVN